MLGCYTQQTRPVLAAVREPPPFLAPGKLFLFFFVYDENKTVGLIPDLHTLEHTGKRTDKREGSKHVTKQSTNTTRLPAEVKVRAAGHVPSCRKQKTADTGTGVFEQGIFHLQTETMLRSRSLCKCCVKSEESCYVPVRAPRSQTGTLLISICPVHSPQPCLPACAIRCSLWSEGTYWVN